MFVCVYCICTVQSHVYWCIRIHTYMCAWSFWLFPCVYFNLSVILTCDLSLLPISPHPYQVECAVHTGYNTVWVASGTPQTSEIAIIECRTAKPCMTECFSVPDRRILSMVYVPAQQKETEMTTTESEEGSQRAKGVPTVWVGCQDGKWAGILGSTHTCGIPRPKLFVWAYVCMLINTGRCM